jgi:Ca2+-transporting ATPase
MTSGPRTIDWLSTPANDVAALAGTDAVAGLTTDEAKRRLTDAGPNVIHEARQRGIARMVLGQFRDVTVLVLIAAAIVSAIVGEPADVVAIAIIVVLNAALGVTQEYRAERAIAALRRLAAPNARVRRGGTTQIVPAATLVPGDILLLEAGNIVPADARLVEVARLTVEEAALTGEAEPVHKIVDEVATAAEIGDRRNMAFQGTAVAGGRATGVVTATGMRTELGRIAALLQDEPVLQTPLQRRLARFGRRLALAAIALCAAILAYGLARGEAPLLMFMTALSIAVAAIPEALPAVVTMSLAIGARRLVRRNALIRRLPAVETLGSVTFICSDKTGTLTEGRMRVERASTPARELIDAVALCNDSHADLGDPTEVALAEFAKAHGRTRAELELLLPRVDELPFSTERARMTTVHRREDASCAIVAYTKGAPERVLAHCVRRAGPKGDVDLDRDAALAEAAALASAGLRVLGVATRTALMRSPAVTELETDQTFLGFVGLADPPRAEAHEAVRLCQTAGIRVVMITGDHTATAFAVASRLGIARAPGQVMSGVELRGLSAEALEARIEGIAVYARVAPEDKIRIVKALQARGELVAMTGDGVNDAPALRRADIGVAMGRGGTDIAREASAMVLLDDNFATIVAAVREGRRVYDNIRKFVRYTLAGNAGEMWALLLAPLFGLPLPLLPIQILWVNLVTDGLPGLALASERAEPDVMQRPPRPPAESVFAGGLWQHVLWAGALIGALTLATQAWFVGHAPERWRTMTFTVLTLAQMGHVLAIRSEHTSLRQLGFRSNMPLNGAVALTLILQAAVVYVPALQRVFGTTALGAGDVALAVGIALVVPFAVEGEKWLVRTGRLHWTRR